MGIRNSAGGKGSAQRNAQVPKEEVDANFDRIFGKKETASPRSEMLPYEQDMSPFSGCSNFIKQHGIEKDSFPVNPTMGAFEIIKDFTFVFVFGKWVPILHVADHYKNTLEKIDKQVMIVKDALAEIEELSENMKELMKRDTVR